MNNEQIQSLIAQLKASGLNEEQIMETFYETFETGEMDRKDLETLANALGYELTDDFKNDSTPDPIAQKDLEGATKEDLEDLKEIEPGESEEEFKEKIDNADDKVETEEEVEEDEDEGEGEEEVEGEGEEEVDEEKEWDEAQKMFKI